MREYLDVEPDQLRRIAEQHHLAAADIRKWGEIPHGWLAEFESSYGEIADPVRAALVDYYNRRHASAERLADNHERTRDELLAAAAALEGADQSGGDQVGKAGGGFDSRAPQAGPAPNGPGDSPVPDTPPVNGTPPAQRPSIPDVTSTSDVPDRFAQPPLSAEAAPQTYDPAHAWADSPTPNMSSIGVPAFDTGVPVSPAVETNSASGGAVDETGAAARTVVDENNPVATPGGMSPPLASPWQAAGIAAGTDTGMVGGTPAPSAAGSFAAAHVAEHRRVLRSFVAGEPVEDDLTLARSLLGAILAAVADSAPGVEWAVAVGRSPLGLTVGLTSTEGRGWMPPGLFVPRGVTLPWRWDSILDTGTRQIVSALEGITDPARILAEFGSRAGRSGSVRITALVSSAVIPDNLRAALGDDVTAEGGVSPDAESAVDLTSPGIGLVDRLALSGPKALRQQAATVPETEIRATCLELARAADAQVCSAVAAVDGELAHRAVRRQLLDALHAGWFIPASWWDEFRAADGMAAAALRARKVDVSDIPLGARLDVTGIDALRNSIFERRADELLLLLADGEPGRQTLRDALYTYGQIVEHPLFPATVHAVADVEISRAGGYGAAGVSVGPAASGAAPPSIAELLNGRVESERFGEQRRA